MKNNQMMIIGNIGSVEDLKYLQSGVAVLSFSVAVNEGYKKDGQWVDKTQWVKVTLWRGFAEAMADKLHKGDRVLVQGSAAVEAYLDKSGQPQAKMVITADNIVNFGRKGEAGPEEEAIREEESIDMPF